MAESQAPTRIASADENASDGTGSAGSDPPPPDAEREPLLGTVGLQSGDYTLAGFEDADVVLAIGYDLVEHSPEHWNPNRDKTIICIDSLPASPTATSSSSLVRASSPPRSSTGPAAPPLSTPARRAHCPRCVPRWRIRGCRCGMSTRCF